LKTIIKSNPLAAFFVLTFAFTWVLWGSAIVLHLSMTGGYLPFLIGASGPTVMAFVVSAITGGRQDVKTLWKRITYWRVGIVWYLAALFIPALIVLGGLGLNMLFGGTPPDLKLLSAQWYLIPIALVVGMLSGGPLEEEFGWRGFALVKLQEKYSAFTASLVVGIIWGLWHLPAFLIPWSTQSGVPLFLFLLHDLALSVLFTWIFNNTGGSVLMSMLAHAAFNLTITVLPVLPSAAGSQLPLEYAIAVMYGLALIVLMVFGPKTLTRKVSKS
jgi:membrane protease YdiL (CAAX protease family)